ncbi:alpha/beta fold hydrolase [Limnohabitans sp. Rim28]|uniref:alpha/beta fold hydrolase n=1 Tax=Limnohabitans sp. Rim28 TaxID=1100720 RepID=UPI00058F6059|nr:alpha/beta hydrolase [Limnohabitans sp. Rim28]PVE06365.1 alpha/beta hydrolase [Limnohabitans sp. Rim28]
MNTTLPPALDADSHTLHALHGACGRIAVYAGGAGPPVLLVHSINALASVAEVRPLFEALCQDHSVYALDLPGYGLSDRLPRAYTVGDMCAAVLQVAQWVSEQHPGQPLQVLAVSLSCEFVARVAQQSPATFASLALVSPTGFRGGKSLRKLAGSTLFMGGFDRFLRRPGPAWGRFLFRQLSRPSVVRYFLQRTWGGKNIDETLWAYAVRCAHVDNAEQAPLSFLSGGLFSADMHNVYESLSLPVWVVHGTRGDFTDYRALSLVRGRPNWQVTVLQAGAMPYFEDIDTFMASYRAFLTQGAKRSRSQPLASGV